MFHRIRFREYYEEMKLEGNGNVFEISFNKLRKVIVNNVGYVRNINFGKSVTLLLFFFLDGLDCLRLCVFEMERRKMYSLKGILVHTSRRRRNFSIV